ncbi:hypothetical protein [Hymenobacter fastidiosus]|uniref:hypothetical protein n=1 Tax=Hymenobacter fastidiosus TaxID=486264 RepID=UPI0031E7D7A1
MNGISETEIRELEQLAAAFPYCQTAHVLLAKAAHDQGSMLASQRLRRAATYAADRELLRRLIEQPAPAIVAAGPVDVPALLVASPPVDPRAVEPETGAEPEAVQPQAELREEIEPEAAEANKDSPAPGATESRSMEQPELTEPAAPAEAEAPTQTTSEPADPVSQAASALDQPTPGAAEDAEPTTSLTIPEADGTTPEEARAEVAEPAADELAAATPSATEPEPAATAGTALAVVADDLLPAVAPPIRPPVEAGAARFEFGLAATTPEISPVYQLPTIDEDEQPAEPPVATPVPSFRADADVAYALGGGSRFGSCLQGRDEFTQALPTDDFFAPDALLLAHIKAHTPPAPRPSRSSFELINKFLRAQPRLKAPTVPPVEEQADLSVRSIRNVPVPASEMLAKIMVRQGKTDKAIEIYEQLMVRQPEKKAYFADQIQQLKPSE